MATSLMSVFSFLGYPYFYHTMPATTLKETRHPFALLQLSFVFLLLCCLVPSTTAFAPPTTTLASFDTTWKIQKVPRGGDTTALQSTMIPSVVTSALQSGPWGVLAMSGIAASVVLPLTMYRQGYSFSVGYGFSVAAMGWIIAKAFGIAFLTTTTTIACPLALLTAGVVFYGTRLGSFLLWREFTVASKKEQIKSFDKTPRLKRIPLAVGVSIFYALMTSPLLYAARAAAGGLVLDSPVTKVGVGLAWFGAIMEAVADGQKDLAKRRGTKDDDDSKFVGPTGGFYQLCRHPNYLGEVLWWVGLAMAGAPTFGKDPIPWVCSLLGLYGIYGIMSGASKRLDGKQKEKYGGQEKYDAYRKTVPATLWPWVRS